MFFFLIRAFCIIIIPRLSPTRPDRKRNWLSAAGPYVRRTKHSPSPRNVNDTDREANELSGLYRNQQQPKLVQIKKKISLGVHSFLFLNQKRKRVEIIFRASSCCFFVSKADGRGMGAGLFGRRTTSWVVLWTSWPEKKNKNRENINKNTQGRPDFLCVCLFFFFFFLVVDHLMKEIVPQVLISTCVSTYLPSHAAPSW